MMKSYFSRLLVVFGCLVVFVTIMGCEDDPETDTSAYFEENPYSSVTRVTTSASDLLTIEPESASLSADGDSTVFKAEGGTPPYTWAVQDISRGSIVIEGESSAAYQRGSAGDNVVVLQDSAGTTVFASVAQAVATEE